MMRGVFSGSLVSCAILAACSGGGGSTGSGTTSSSGVDSFAAQYCDLFAPCCARASKGYDQTRCTAVLSALAGSRPYDPARGQQCIDAARAESGSATFCDEGLSDATDAICEKVLAASNGSKEPGATCESDEDCAASPDGDVNCTTFFESNATKRICQVDLRGKENDDCTATRDGNTTFGTTTGGALPRRTVCFTSDGLYCSGTTKKCARVQGVGGPCEFSSSACDKTSYCDTTSRTCAAKKPAGADCTSSPSGQCADGHYCDDTTKKCTLEVPVGGACTKNTQCANGSCTNGKCSGSSLSTALFCAP